MSPLSPRQYRPDPAASQNRQTYIPQGMQAAMSQHAQQSLPAHLRQYADGSGRYVPQHAQKAISEHLNKTAPGHLKQYADAYVQQSMVDRGSIRPGINQSAGGGRGPAPIPNTLRRDHSGFVGSEQHTVQAMNLFAPDASDANQPPGSAPPQAGPAAASPASAQPAYGNYDFIMSANQVPAQKPLPGSGSLAGRILLFSGGLLVLLVAFVLVRSLLFSPPSLEHYITVAQDQQAILHIVAAEDSSQLQSLSDNTRNFIATTQLTMASSQAQLTKYLAENKVGIKPEQLNLKISTKTDEQLKAAIAAATYDQTFRDTMEQYLNTYMSNLQQIHKQAAGQARGQALLSDSFDQAELLLNQLQATDSTPAES